MYYLLRFRFIKGKIKGFKPIILNRTKSKFNIEDNVFFLKSFIILETMEILVCKEDLIGEI
jgi:hypothetical protein